jgi:C-terminal processing protease CtpA/Prc
LQEGRGAHRLLLGLCLLATAVVPSRAREDASRVLTFEAARSPLAGWGGGPPGTLFLDSTIVHEGRYSGRAERAEGSPSAFSTFTMSIPVDFKGDTLELRGWLKYENVTGFVGLWQRQDARSGGRSVQFDNMAERQLKGTADWTEYRSKLPISPQARTLVFGALLVGQGRMWVDDLRLFVDGRPLADVPTVVAPNTVLDTDREFDSGSKIELSRLATAQIDKLVLLGKVWGFLKYHHPAVVGGKRHWDYDLFRELPLVLAARDRAACQQELARWVASLGEVPPCSSCVKLPTGRPVVPRLGWLADRKLLGRELSASLTAVHERRPNVEEQFFVGQVPNIGNPDFSNELGYSQLKQPDAGYRLLALYRYWNMIEYWYPNRDLIEESWDGVLREFVPRLAAAGSHDEYATAMLALIARVHDTHANLWSSLEMRPPRGRAQVPVRVRFIDSQAVVVGYTNARLGPASGLRIGDAIEAIDGVRVDTLVARWRPLYAVSNEAAESRDIARALTRGDSGAVSLAVVRDGAPLEVHATRVPQDLLDTTRVRRHDLPGPTFRRLSDDVAYLKLSTVRMDEVPSYLSRAAGSRCLVIDIRNYPSAFMVFALGQHLVDRTTPFATFTKGDLRNPGSFDWTPPVTLTPEPPHFEGGVAILVDEVSQSQAEYTAMALRARPGAVVVGSMTAGADGNVSPIPLPGGLSTRISGIGVFYPDHRPTQRVGIVPDVVAKPTLAGIRAGRDEVLEAAIQRVLGRPMTDPERAAMVLDAEKVP